MLSFREPFTCQTEVILNKKHEFRPFNTKAEREFYSRRGEYSVTLFKRQQYRLHNFMERTMSLNK